MIRKGKWNDSLVSSTINIQGIITNVDPMFVPDGFVPEMTNLKPVSGQLESINNGSIVNIFPDKISTIFVWHRDNSQDVILVQAGTQLYSNASGSFTSIHTFTNAIPCSFSGGFFDSLYIMHNSGFFKYDGNAVTQISGAPKANYLLLWQTYLFTGGSLVESDGTNAPFRVRWSPFADASLNDWYSNDSVNNFVDFRTTENSNIVGIGVWNRRIIVFTVDSIEEMAGSKPSNFIINTIYKGNLTAINNQSIAYYDYVYYLSPSGLCVMAKDAITIGDIYKKYWTRNAMNYSLSEHNGVLYGNSDDDIIAYNTFNKTFYHLNIDGAAIIHADNGDMYIGKNNGELVKMDDSGAPLAWEVKTKEEIYGSPALWKRSMGVDIFLDPINEASTVNVSAIYDGVEENVGSFDANGKNFIHFNLTHGLFKKVQIKLSGNGKIKIIGIETTAKVKRKGGI